MKWLHSVCGVFGVAFLLGGLSVILAESGGRELNSHEKNAMYGGQKGPIWTIDHAQKCSLMSCIDAGDCSISDPENDCPFVETAAVGEPVAYECNQDVVKECHHHSTQSCVIVSSCVPDGVGGCITGSPIATSGFKVCDTHDAP